MSLQRDLSESPEDSIFDDQNPPTTPHAHEAASDRCSNDSNSFLRRQLVQKVSVKLPSSNKTTTRVVKLPMKRKAPFPKEPIGVETEGKGVTNHEDFQITMKPQRFLNSLSEESHSTNDGV
jgi:hypothetical protein